jgi:uncharacterized protein YcnI
VTNRRLAAAVALAAVGVVAAAPMAAAHVTVNPGEAEKGGFAALTFRVPNERDDATTTSVEVNFPEEHPITSVRVKPTPGWEYAIEMRTLDEPLESHGEEITEVVSKITWTGGEIGTTEFQEFPVSAGPLPEDADQIMFPAIQTYSSGEEVRWIDEVVEGEEEPEFPAPTLKLVDPAEGGGHDDGAEDEQGEEAEGDGAEGESAGGLTVENAASQDDVDSANTLATIGIVVGVLGLLAGGFALYTSRKRSA